MYGYRGPVPAPGPYGFAGGGSRMFFGAPFLGGLLGGLVGGGLVSSALLLPRPYAYGYGGFPPPYGFGYPYY